MFVFSDIREWVTFAADICILLITVYTFTITFISKKIKFLNFSESHSINEGDHFSVVIENKSLSPQVIKSIYIIFENKHKIEVKTFDSPLILEPYKAQKVESERFSYTVPPLHTLVGKDIILEITTSRKTLYLPFHKKTLKAAPDMKRIPYNVTKIANTYNGKIVPQGTKFILLVSKENWRKTVFIFATGVMTDEILGYNGIPPEAAKDKNSMLNFLDSWLKPTGVEYYVGQPRLNLFEQESIEKS